jgi:hypothetical protein
MSIVLSDSRVRTIGVVFSTSSMLHLQPRTVESFAFQMSGRLSCAVCI